MYNLYNTFGVSTVFSLGLILMEMWVLLMFSWMFSGVSTEFYAGRIKPGKFEYPELNGFMLVNEAVVKCENDLACGGFTFKGSYRTPHNIKEIYFFHVVLDSKDNVYLYWSTYKVNRKYVKLSKVILNSEMVNSKKIDLQKLHYLDDQQLTYDEMMKNINAVAFQPKHQMAYSKIDFGDFVTSNDIEDTIIINLHLDHMIEHTFPKIDRCCSLKDKKINFDGVDNMERIDCSIDQEEFTKKYVDTREAIIMSGCQTKWKATNWTIGNILDRYDNTTINGKTKFFSWNISWYKDPTRPKKIDNFKASEVKDMIKSGFFVKFFKQLPKHLKGWVDQKRKVNIHGYDLLDEYSFPKPMPEDKFHEYHYDTSQAYLMLATEGTGTKMHVDPQLTDAFNALISGEKWWVSLPKDLYEFKDEFSCDESCSDPPNNHHRQTGVWFIHIMPQIRQRIFFGQKLKSFLQKPGETLYMPHMVLHSVWNVSPSVAVGDNPLYETSFDEWIGSDVGAESYFIRDRIILKTRGYAKSKIDDLMEQVDEAISKNKIVNYSKPKIFGVDE